jgi:hypothetical protein
MSGWDALSEEAREKLGAWPAKSRELFKELVEDASTEMQRELLQRAVAAGHTPAEIHAFADELRVLPDEEAFDACTLDAAAPEGYTVVQLLRAEADPLYAYELKGHTLSPADEVSGQASPMSLPYVVPPTSFRARPNFDSGSKPTVARAGAPAGFASDGASGRHKRIDPNDLGESVDAVPRARPSSGPVAAVPPASPVAGARLMEDLLNDAARGLGVTFKEQDVDDALLSLETALGTAATAVARGLPVPVALGPALGQHRRLALLLQTSMSTGKRAWQIYDPHSAELYWVSETDLLSRSELPFAIKTNRRITRIALPIVKATSL